MTIMNELPLYQIIDWNEHFENNKSRTRDSCSFVCVPNKHGGSGLANVLGEPNGAAIYGIWMLILQLCSRQRRPRQGYLTADGKREGRRLGAAELARLFRRPIAEITCCLRVISSGEVAFMRLLEGAPEGHLADTPGTPEGHSHGHSADTAGALEGHSSVLNEDTERKKERKNFSLSGEIESEKADTAGTPEGHSADTPGTPEGHSADTAGTPEGHSADTDVIQHTEAKRLFGKLCQDVFGEPRYETQWPDDENHWLDAALPMKRETWDLIDWFYRLPTDHRIFKVTRRRQSMRMLMENIRSEPQKIRSARQLIGLNGLHDKSVERQEDVDLTPEQVAAAKKIYGDDVLLPAKWEQLESRVREEITEAMAQ